MLVYNLGVNLYKEKIKMAYKIDLEKCKGCKVCVVEKACPMKAISVIDNKVSLNTDYRDIHTMSHGHRDLKT